MICVCVCVFAHLHVCRPQSDPVHWLEKSRAGNAGKRAPLCFHSLQGPTREDFSLQYTHDTCVNPPPLARQWSGDTPLHPSQVGDLAKVKGEAHVGWE